MSEFIRVTKENIDKEHICCGLSGKKDSEGVCAKKKWMKEQFDHGLTFIKLNTRGKVMIEYIPAEHAWCPIDAPGYMHINCLWVAGQFKGQGYSSQLLEACIEDAKKNKRKGLTIVTSEKKRPFLCDSKYLRHKGFQLADCAAPYFQLYYLPLEEDAEKPKVCMCAKNGEMKETGLVLYYTNQCPYTEIYAGRCAAYLKEQGIKLKVHKIITEGQAQNAPSLVTTYALFQDGRLITNEIMNEAKIAKMI